MASERFRDRREAGRLLAQKLAAFANRPDVVVLALPRGGVPVAYEVARALGAPLDVFVVRKLGVPGHEELAMGAVATGVTLVVVLTAAAVVVTVPVMILVLLFQRRIVAGLTAGAVKG